LKRLIKDALQKGFLIVDILRVHHSNEVRKWVEKHTDEIEIFYLPPYNTGTKSDEYLNQGVNTSLGSKKNANRSD
jgi:hypothetical protein